MLRMLKYRVVGMTIRMNLGKDSYNIIVERGIIATADKHLNLNRRVLVVTDSGVPKTYAKTVKNNAKTLLFALLNREKAQKALRVLPKSLKQCLIMVFKKDCVIAVGGGVVGDLTGFVASAYMRGIDFTTSRQLYFRKLILQSAERRR